MIVNQQYSDYVSPLDRSSMSYPNILTPPSSSEDSPQSVFLVASPTSNTFEYEHYAVSPMETSYVPQSNMMIDPNMIKLESHPKASLHFIEQPTDRFRFRYKSEMAGTHGSLIGINSNKSRKLTYPTVELKNCTGRVIVRCSIYQSNANGKDFLPHAHRLIMKKGKEEHDDPHDIIVGPEDGYVAVFQGMGIIHTAKKNIVSELVRKKIQLKKEAIAREDGKLRELNTKEIVAIKGLAESESKSINLNIVCLRFDAFIKQNGILYPICDPIFSHGINNLKSALTGDLKIVRLDHVVSPAKGNKEIFILVERVTKKNIKIRFYELDDDERVVWEDWGRFNDLDVHHQYAIVFKTPKYHDENITQPVRVFVELFRPSDSARSEPREFRYIPNKNNHKPGQKRPRIDDYSTSYSSNEISSGDLPLPISNLQIERSASRNGKLNSEDLDKALQNIDSDEFQKLFSEFGPDFSNMFEDQVEHDAPLARNKIPMFQMDIATHQMAPIQHCVKMEVTKEEQQMAKRVLEEFKSFFRTSYTKEKALDMLNHYFGEDRKTNALHVTICQKEPLLLKIILKFNRFDLLENSNNESQTPLHLAVLSLNKQMIKILLHYKCKISALDNDLNTALHLAIKSNAPIDILEILLTNRECERINEYIDMENDEGNTPLVMAIDKRSLSTIKLLYLRGADVNKTHPKNGFVPLRFAIEKKLTDIVKYFLSLPYINATIKDFQNVSPLTAAMDKEDGELTGAVKKYMTDNNILLEVKEEPEDDSEDEMEIDEDYKVKTEDTHLSNEELEKLYKGVTKFTPQCFDEVSSILDRSENWKCLAELLNIEHLITSGIIHSDLSMSKAVLTYSLDTNNDNIWMIRNFLDYLDEFAAVEVMDRMVQDVIQT